MNPVRCAENVLFIDDMWKGHCDALQRAPKPWISGPYYLLSVVGVFQTPCILSEENCITVRAIAGIVLANGGGMFGLHTYVRVQGHVSRHHILRCLFYTIADCSQRYEED